MTEKSESEEFSFEARHVFYLISAVFVGVPAVLGLLLWVPANVITRVGSAGQFVAAVSHQGGFASPDLTNVQSSVGTIIVKSPFSAPRGQKMLIRDSYQYGLQLCPASDTSHCVSIAGNWSGPMRTVPHVTHWYDIDFASIGIDGRFIGLNLFLGVIVALVSLIIGSAGSQEKTKKD